MGKTGTFEFAGDGLHKLILEDGGGLSFHWSLEFCSISTFSGVACAGETAQLPRGVGVGETELIFDGTREMLDAKWTYWGGLDLMWPI